MQGKRLLFPILHHPILTQFQSKYICLLRFRTVTLDSFIPSLQAQNWFLALNLQEASFHIAMMLAHRKYLRFTWGPNHYQYEVLPFGLYKPLRVFTKYLVMVTVHLIRQGIHIHLYLDDGQIRGKPQHGLLVRHPMDKNVPVPSHILAELTWWLEPKNIRELVPFSSPCPTKTLITDISGTN